MNGVSALEEPASHGGLVCFGGLDSNLAQESKAVKATQAQDGGAGLGATRPDSRAARPQEVPAVRQDVAELSQAVLNKSRVIPDGMVHQDELGAFGVGQGLSPAFGRGLQARDMSAPGRALDERGACEKWTDGGDLGAQGFDRRPIQVVCERGGSSVFGARAFLQ